MTDVQILATVLSVHRNLGGDSDTDSDTRDNV